jgi:hypothetical protein
VALVGDEGAIFEAHVLQVVDFELVVDESQHLLAELFAVALGLLGVVLRGTAQLVPAYSHQYSYCCLTLFW